MNRCSRLRAWTGLSAVAAVSVAGTASSALAQDRAKPPMEELLSPSGLAALRQVRAMRGDPGINLSPSDDFNGDLPGPRGDMAPFGTGGEGTGRSEGGGSNRRFRNTFVNDPCLDPARTTPIPADNDRVVQSETEIAILNNVGGDDDDRGRNSNDNSGKSGRFMVAGYNDSYGFYDNRQGLSGVSYSTDGGKNWIDASGLPPKFPTGVPSGTLGSDAYFGDPVVVVHHKSKTFYYASIYMNAAGGFTLSVNSGRFKRQARQVPVESKANTRCERNPGLHGVPDDPGLVRERIIWNPPVEAAVPVIGPLPGDGDDDFLDKEWLYVDQQTGFLYLTYTRFAGNGATPIELVRSFDGGLTWTPPSVIVANEAFDFNQATMPIVTPTGRVVVTWFARTFQSTDPFTERAQRIEAAFSDNCQTPAPCTFSPEITVASVNPQGEPLGYNRARPTILNAPFIAVDKGRDDGKITHSERRKSGFGNVYITYFDGFTPLAATGPNPPFARRAEIHFSRSTTNGSSWGPEVKVNDDVTPTTHVFPSVEVNEDARVFVTWLDRRVDAARNILTDTFGDISRNRGSSFGKDVRISDVSTDWFVRADAAPNFGDYNSTDVIDFKSFVSIWADGRFPTPPPITTGPPFARDRNLSATPDTIFEIFGDGDDDHNDDD